MDFLVLSHLFLLEKESVLVLATWEKEVQLTRAMDGERYCYSEALLPHTSGAQRESAAHAFRHSISDGRYVMKHPAFGLAENPGAPVVS